MKNKHLALTLGAIITSLLILFSCKKINEATELGDDLIPPVDNITTFDTTLEVEAFTDTFSLATDSAFSFSSFNHYLGIIGNDPFFGRTNAQILLELKPPSYRFSFGNVPDSLSIDSVVLVLDYLETYGDTVLPQTVSVYEIGGQITDFQYDTIYKFRQPIIPRLGLLGSRTFEPRILNDSIKAYKDTTLNQLRIRLDDAFGQRLLDYDSTGPNGAYKSDTNFRQNFKGFAIESVSGNAVMGFNLNGINTKLAIYYKDDHNSPSSDKWDTLVSYFGFTAQSAAQNYVFRDYGGTPVAAASGGTIPDNFVYIQNTPGTFAMIKIPGLAGLNNRIVHRAELIMEQAYHISDSLFPPPPRLYLDAYDPVVTAFRTVPFDLLYDFANRDASNLISFGAAPFRAQDVALNNIRTWRFNLTRYVQHVVNDTEPAFDLRVYAPVYTINQYGVSGKFGDTVTVHVNSSPDFTGSPVKGRVRLHGGDPTQANPQRMRLRVVYSKI